MAGNCFPGYRIASILVPVSLPSQSHLSLRHIERIGLTALDYSGLGSDRISKVSMYTALLYIIMLTVGGFRITLI